MRLIIFGSTGTIGKLLVAQALKQGDDVTAFTRNPDNLAEIKHPKLRIQKGDVLDYTAVEKAVTGHDAVLCALGAGRQGRVRSEGTLNIIRAMEKAGIQRFVCQTTLGAGESWGNLNFFWKKIMFGWFLKEAFIDHELQEKHIQESNLSWTIVRPGAFTNEPAKGQYKHGFPSDDRSTKLKIARADVAGFMLLQLESDQYLRKTPGLSY